METGEQISGRSVRRGLLRGRGWLVARFHWVSLSLGTLILSGVWLQYIYIYLRTDRYEENFFASYQTYWCPCGGSMEIAPRLAQRVTVKQTRSSFHNKLQNRGERSLRHQHSPMTHCLYMNNLYFLPSVRGIQMHH